MTRRVMLWVAAVLALCPAPLVASPPELAQVVTRGRAALAAGRCEEALVDFALARRSVEHIPDRAGLIGNIALCLARLGRWVEALDTFRETRALVLVDPAPSQDPQADRLARVDAHIADLEARIGRVDVRCDLPTVTLAVAGRPAAVCPATFEVDPGRITVRGRAADGRERAAQVEAVAGEGVTVTLAFAPPPSPPDEVATVAVDDGSNWPWIALGIGAGAAVVVGVTVLLAGGDEAPRTVGLRLEE